MKDINTTTLTARTTQIPVLKYTQAGTPILYLPLAVNYNVKKGEEWKEETSFFDAEYWGKPAEAVSRLIGKGTGLTIEGEFRQDRWEQDGQPRSKIKLHVVNLRVMDYHRETSQAEQGGLPADPAPTPSSIPRQPAFSVPPTFPARPQETQVERPRDNFDDDLPF